MATLSGSMRKKSRPISVYSHIQVAVVGDGGVGKSSIVFQFCFGKFVTEYDPTVEDNYQKTMALDDDMVQLDIVDTAGQEDYKMVTKNACRNCDGFLLVFDITRQKSFNRLPEFIQDINQVKQKDIKRIDVPIVIVGNKSDLDEKREVLATVASSFALKKGCAFFETSAKTGKNISEAWTKLASSVTNMKPSEPKFSLCVVL